MTHQSSSQALIRLCFLFVVLVPWVATTFAQNAAPSAIRNKDLKKIDSRATKVDEPFLHTAFGIAAEYENAGDVARAVDYLHAMSLLKPGQPIIEEKLKQLREQIMSANDFSFEYEPTTSWGKPVAYVRAGKPFRIASQGEYKLSITSTVGSGGFPEDDGKSELIDDVPLGKLTGIILDERSQTTGPVKKGKGKGKKKPMPFEIGSGLDITPKKSGYLFLKVNLPSQSQSSGSLLVQLSGYVLAPDGKNVGK